MTRFVSGRGAARLCVGAGLLAVCLTPTAASAAEPAPLPAAVSPAASLLGPSPSPSPSPSAGPLDPVLDRLPAPVASPVKEAVRTVTGVAPAPAPPPAPPPAPAPAVKPNAGTNPQQVAAPRTGVAGFPGLSAGVLRNGTGSSGLAPLSAGMAAGSLDGLFSVPDVTTPVAAPQATAAGTRGPAAPVPAGLPALLVVVAIVTVGGAAAGQLAVMRARRASAPA